MELEDLLELLELDEPDDFSCFENLAELLETDEEVLYEPFYLLLKDVPAEVLEELIQNYFEDIQTGISDDAIDFYTLLTTIGQSLAGLAKADSDEDSRRLLIDELFRFRGWYREPAQVVCVSHADGCAEYLSVNDALALYRAEKLLQESYDYDYTDCLDYPIDEYVMNFSLSGTENGYEDDMREFSDEDDNEDEDYGCGCGHAHSHAHGHSHRHGCDCGCENKDGGSEFDPFRDGLIDPENPVIDGEGY